MLLLQVSLSFNIFFVPFMIVFISSLNLVTQESDAHRDGCHKLHSCPSDTGSYVCGDLGDDSKCSVRNYSENKTKNSTGENHLNTKSPNNLGYDLDDFFRDLATFFHLKSENDAEIVIDEAAINHGYLTTKPKTTENLMTNQSSIATTTVTKNTKWDTRGDCEGTANCLLGMVTKVIDGDTVDVDDGKRIRLSLVNTPERNEPGYAEAKDFVQKVCGVGKPILVDEDDRQKEGSYGRMIGLVYCGDEHLISLNQILVEKGYAKILPNFCQRSEFSYMMWAQNNGCN